MSSKTTKDTLILGFGIWALLFGAGNLIFPPVLGYQAGANWGYSLIGFIITDVLLSVICIISFNKYKNFHTFAKPMGSLFINVYIYSIVIFLMFCIVIPRTAATTYEIAIKDYLPWLNSWVFYIFYFLITLCFSINPSKVFDNLGKILSPLLFFFLIVICIIGFFTVHPHYVHPPIEKNPLSNGLIQGYQTIDALAAALQASLSIMVLTSKNYASSDQIKIILKACLIVTILLSSFYFGLTYLGAAIGSTISPVHQIDTLVAIVHGFGGRVGGVIFAGAVFFACITSAIGLLVLGAFLITDLLHSKNESKDYQKLYRSLIIIFSIVGIFIAKNGVDTILVFTVPFLDIVYPILIVMTFLNLLNMRHPFVMRSTIYVTIAISIISILGHFHFELFAKIASYFPLYKEGFIWLLPSIVVAGFTQIAFWKKNH